MSSKRPQPFFSRSQVTLVRGLWMVVTAILAFMTLFPLLWMVSIAFKPAAESFSSNLIPQAPTLDNFIYVLTGVLFIRDRKSVV